MNLFKKAACASLAALLLVSACACGSPEDPETTQAASEAGNAGTEGETEYREPLDLPEDLTFPNQTLTFMTRDEGSDWTTTEIFADEEDFASSNISEAVHTRNVTILDKYGVTIDHLVTPTGDMPSKVNLAVQSGGNDFQAVISNAVNATSMSSNGLIWNLLDTEIEYLDLDKPWWDNQLTEGIIINDMVFFATGDLLTADNDATFVMMFNKDIAAEYNVPSIYSLVDNYEWTLDKLYEFEQKVEGIDGGDGKLDHDTDLVPFAMTNDSYYSVLYAGGIKLVGRDSETNSPIYALDVERADNLATKARKVFAKNLIFRLDNTDSVIEAGKVCFGGGHALFFGECLQCVERLRGYDIEFGVIPYPQYDENQKAYYHMMHSTGSVVCIPRQISGENLEMTSAMLEAMAYYSQDTLTKQYYEINLTSKYSKDEQSGPMIDLILATRVFDLAYYYDWGELLPLLTSALQEDSTAQVSSANRKFSKQITAAIEKTLKDIANNYKE